MAALKRAAREEEGARRSKEERQHRSYGEHARTCLSIAFTTERSKWESISIIAIEHNCCYEVCS